MPSGPVAESESRFDNKLSTLSEEKDTESRDSWVRLGKVGTESDGFGTQDFDANTEFRHSAFSRAVSVVCPFEVRVHLSSSQIKAPCSHLPKPAVGLVV